MYTCPQRASITAQTMPSMPRAFSAIARSVETPAQVMFRAIASPLTHDTPMRTPVNEPGPADTARQSTSSSVFAESRRTASAIGISVWLCVCFVLM